MSEDLQDIEDELAADQPGVFSGADVTKKQVHGYAAFYVSA